jgi:hypothetical protein
MNQQIPQDKIIDLYYYIQQAFLFKIDESIISISFDIKDNIILRVYVKEKLFRHENSELFTIPIILNNKFSTEVKSDIRKIGDKPLLSEIDTLAYKFFLNNELMQDEENDDDGN